MTIEFERGRYLITRLELLQYQYFNGRPQWTTVKLENLKLFMAYTYFGSPFQSHEVNEEVIEEVNDDIFNYYKDEEKKCILNMIEIIQKKILNTDDLNILVGFTMTHSICKINCDVCQNFPEQDIHCWFLLRIKLNLNSVVYVDLHHNRTYNDWNDYIENNSLPQGYMFYPESGYYEEQNYLFQSLTPASRKTERVLRGFDLVGRTATFASGILLASGLIFPVMAPVLLPSAITIGSSSAWDIGRQISKLSDLNKHNQSLAGKEAGQYWLNLSVSALGVITAPMNATVRTLELGGSAIFASKLAKSLLIVQKGICIAQCSLEVFRVASMMNKNKKITLNDWMTLRLDLFVVMGTLLPISYIQEILEVIVSGITFTPIYRYMSSLPYCIFQYICTGVNFIKKHLSVFIIEVKKHLMNDLTVDKLLSAYNRFSILLKEYKKLLGTLSKDDLLKHIVYDITTVSCEEPEEVKHILSGQYMRTLLNKLSVKPDQSLIQFCIGYVMEKAEVVSKVYEQSMNELIVRGYVDLDKNKEEFCREYNLERCCMSQFVVYSLRETDKDLKGFMAAYSQHKLKNENIYSECLVSSEINDTRSLSAYSIPAPCNGLNHEICLSLVREIEPQNHDNNNYQYINATQFKPNVSILYSCSAFSVKIVFFSVSLFEGSPTFNISFYQDSQGSIDKRLDL